MVEPAHHLPRNARQGSAPAGVHHRHNFGFRSDVENGYAVGSEHAKKSVRLFCHHAVSLTSFFYTRVLNLNDVIAMHLFHGNDPTVVNSYRQLHVADILTDSLDVVADTIRGV